MKKNANFNNQKDDKDLNGKADLLKQGIQNGEIKNEHRTEAGDTEDEESEITEEDIKKMLKEIKEEYEREKQMEKNNRSLGIRGQIAEWLKRVSYPEFQNAICETVMGQEGVEYILMSIYYYLSALASGKRHHNHVLVAAPSGCGKSATYLAVRDYFSKEIPSLVVQRTDVSNITETSYRGDDPVTILSPLFERVPNENGEGILFLDEFDKKMVPSTTSRGENTNLAVQGQLLTMLEGCCYHEPNNTEKTVDTANTLFIAMGSFDEVRRKRRIKADDSKISIGFNHSDEEAYDHFEEITKEDILKLGSTYELMGRFPMVINFHPLTKEVVKEIIQAECRKIESLLDTNIKLDPSFLKELEKEMNGPLGCRVFYNRIYVLSGKACHDILLKGYRPEESEILLKSDGKYVFRKKSHSR